jgi:hypothetical protein
MSAIKARWHIDFMPEEEQLDDPVAIERWVQELRALPALTMTAEQEAEMAAWRDKAKQFNLEAVRRQMGERIPFLPWEKVSHE